MFGKSEIVVNKLRETERFFQVARNFEHDEKICATERGIWQVLHRGW